jgi:hypothetical protein
VHTLNAVRSPAKSWACAAGLGLVFAWPSSQQPTPSPQADKKVETVYVTRTGKKYHREVGFRASAGL